MTTAQLVIEQSGDDPIVADVSVTTGMDPVTITITDKDVQIHTATEPKVVPISNRQFYPANVTYSGRDLEDVRSTVHDLVGEIADGEDDNYKAWYAEGAEAILVWLAAGKPPAEAYDAGNSMLADLIRGAQL